MAEITKSAYYQALVAKSTGKDVEAKALAATEQELFNYEDRKNGISRKIRDINTALADLKQDADLNIKAAKAGLVAGLSFEQELDVMSNINDEQDAYDASKEKLEASKKQFEKTLIALEGWYNRNFGK
jgi:predicted  nucleic acid-binding Zn-ribbon protein